MRRHCVCVVACPYAVRRVLNAGARRALSERSRARPVRVLGVGTVGVGIAVIRYVRVGCYAACGADELTRAAIFFEAGIDWKRCRTNITRRSLAAAVTIADKSIPARTGGGRREHESNE